jgi:hypothetical protein
MVPNIKLIAKEKNPMVPTSIRLTNFLFSRSYLFQLLMFEEYLPDGKIEPKSVICILVDLSKQKLEFSSAVRWILISDDSCV